MTPISCERSSSLSPPSPPSPGCTRSRPTGPGQASQSIAGPSGRPFFSRPPGGSTWALHTLVFSTDFLHSRLFCVCNVQQAFFRPGNPCPATVARADLSCTRRFRVLCSGGFLHTNGGLLIVILTFVCRFWYNQHTESTGRALVVFMVPQYCAELCRKE